MLKDKAVIQSIDEDSKACDELVDCAVYLIETKIPIIQRAGIIRNQAKMLSMPLSSKDVFSIMAKARRDIQGIDKGEEPNVELDVPETLIILSLSNPTSPKSTAFPRVAISTESIILTDLG